MHHLRSDFSNFDPQGGGGKTCFHINVHISKKNADIYTVLALKCNKHNLFLRIVIRIGNEEQSSNFTSHMALAGADS